jgi:hypothetical protein
MFAKRIGIMVFVLALLALPALRADEEAAEVQYGKGVQAFFAGDLASAIQAFDASIQERAHDPRPYFFRGTAHLIQGSQKDALSDFAAGAALEASPAGQPFDVDAALERIQGPARLEIEKQRKKARAEALAQRRPNEYAVTPGKSKRFDPANLPDLSALADPTIPFPDTSVTPYFAPAKTARSQPVAVPAVTPDVQPNAPTGADDPFAGGNDAPMDSEMPKGDDPAANEGAAPQPAKEPDSDDPFGGG